MTNKESNKMRNGGLTLEGFNDFLAKAKKLTDTMGKKANEAIDVSKLKLSASQIQADIRKTYEKLGEIVYKSSLTHADTDKIVKMCTKELDELFDELEKVNNKINDIKRLKKCRKCGYGIPSDAMFCAKCGTPVNEKNVPEKESEDDEETAAFTTPIESVIDDINRDE